MSGAYIVIEGVDEAAKQAVLAGIAERLRELDRQVILLDANPPISNTAQAIVGVVRSKRRGLSHESRLLLRGAQLVESLRALRPGIDQGTIYLAPKGYVDFLVRSFYGSSSEEDYQTVNAIVSYAARRTPPTLTLLIDGTTDAAKSANDAETARTEKLRAGFLWEAKQRELPIVYESDNPAAALDQAWRHVAAALHLEQEAIQQPTAIADVLASSPAAKLMTEKQHITEAISQPPAYYVPSYLPDDLQCDYCDEVDRLLAAHKSLVRQLAEYLSTLEGHDAVSAAQHAEDVLRDARPLAVSGKDIITALSHVHSSEDGTLDAIAAAHYDDRTDSIRLRLCQPLNELDLVPYMLAGEGKDPSTKLNFGRWTYEAKRKAYDEYMSSKRPKHALATGSYSWDCFTTTARIMQLAEQIADFETYIQQGEITPRYGYETPMLVEEAGLSDAYDNLFDLSLQSYSSLYATGHIAEAQYLTLLGHKQPWTAALPGDVQFELISDQTNWLTQEMASQIEERHPLFAAYSSKKVDTITTRA